jgi:exopolyphosphatase/guanosine-5'-triphosphate,3'-diphosphate pyrophosphatase
MVERARVLGAAMRVAYLISAGQSGVLPHTPLAVRRGRLELRLQGRYAALSGSRVFGRLRQLARLIGREPFIVN